MILVFGALNIDIRLNLHQFPKADSHDIRAKSYSMSDGGRAANQAFAAAKSDAKVALIAKTGSDELCRQMLQRLRQGGVITSGVAKSDDLPAGLCLQLIDRLDSMQTLRAAGANDELDIEQVPEEIITQGTIALVQNEIPATTNMAFLAKAKAGGATTILNLAPSIEMEQKTLAYVDYLVINQQQAMELGKKLGLNMADTEVLKLAKALAIQGDLTCIITRGGSDALAVNPEGKGWRVEALPLEEVVDKTGSEDAYCGTLAACLHGGLDLPEAMRRASVAASLSCTKHGGQESYPYLDEINQNVKELNEAEEIEV